MQLKGFGPYGTVGLDMVLAVVVGLLGGRWLDSRIGGGRGWLTVVGFLLGIAASFNILWKAARRLREETEREDRELQQKAEAPKQGQEEQGREDGKTDRDNTG